MENKYAGADTEMHNEDAWSVERFGGWLPVGLCLAGVFLVLFSNSLGTRLVREPGGWSAERAERAGEIIRWIGGMTFAAGLTERIAAALAKIRSV